MILKCGDNYLDFDGDITIERQAKLFSSLDKTSGDFSYEFDLPDTEKNIKILKLYSPNQANKVIYNTIVCEIQSDSGLTIYYGKLRVEKYKQHKITCSFFSGNSNWVSEITSALSDLDFSQYDLNSYSFATLQSTWNNEHGLIFPLFDKGALSDRFTPAYYYNDLAQLRFTEDEFYGFIYVKDVIKIILQHHGLKMSGELLNDALFNRLIISQGKANFNQIETDKRTSFVTGVQTSLPSGVYTKLIYNENGPGAYQGANKNYANSKYTVDTGGEYFLDYNMRYVGAPSNQTYLYQVRVNNVSVDISSLVPASQGFGHAVLTSFAVNAGDVIELFIQPVTNTETFSALSNLKIYPIYFVKRFASQYVPTMESADLLRNIFAMFNVITSYDITSRTITANLFKNLKSKTPIDLSKYYNADNSYDDYTDFINDFAKINTLGYSKSDEDSIKTYNDQYKQQFGDDTITINNDYLNTKPGQIVKLDFLASKDYINPQSQISLMKFNILNIDSFWETDINSVTNDGTGIAIFHCTNPFGAIPLPGGQVGDLVQISNSSVADYNGSGMVISSTVAGADLQLKIDGLRYEGATTTGKIKSLRLSNTDSDPIIGVSCLRKNITDISSLVSSLKIGIRSTNTISTITSVGYAYFHRVNQFGLSINALNQGLAFGQPLSHEYSQETLGDSYWGDVKRILNDPVKNFGSLYLPEVVFNKISPLVPCRVTTDKFSILFYLNRVTGYKNSFTPCIMELIKID